MSTQRCSSCLRHSSCRVYPACRRLILFHSTLKLDDYVERLEHTYALPRFRACVTYRLNVVSGTRNRFHQDKLKTITLFMEGYAKPKSRWRSEWLRSKRRLRSFNSHSIAVCRISKYGWWRSLDRINHLRFLLGASVIPSSDANCFQEALGRATEVTNWRIWVYLKEDIHRDYANSLVFFS